MIKKNLLIAGAMLLIMTAFSVNKVQAQTCVMPPSCEDLGYTMTEADCASAEKILKCPHDQSKMFCLTMAEIDPGSSGNAGDILYEDHTTRADYVYMVDNRAIGVVFDPVNRLAIALDEGYYRWAMLTSQIYYRKNSSMDWTYLNVALQYGIDEKDVLKDLMNCETNALTCGKGGKENTAIIMAQQTELQNLDERNKNINYFSAADYCYKYQPGSVSSVKSWFAAGQWFLPNVAELNILYQNKDKVNAALQKINRNVLQSGRYWASTRYVERSAWALEMVNGELRTYDMYDYTHYVRPVLAF